MKYTTLGRTGLKVSKLCLGTMNFGSATDKEESFKIMDEALDRGINFFDVADFYGNPPGKGVTEEIVGDWMAQGGRRDRLVLATKCYATMGDGVNDRGLSAYHVRRACTSSLNRLRTDHIDLYLMHHIDRGVRSLPELGNVGRTCEFDLVAGPRGNFATPWEEIHQAFTQLTLEGKITYTGSCNFPAWAIAHYNGLANHRNSMGITIEQSTYNLNNRFLELEVIPACRELGVGLMIYSPLAGGLLVGKKNMDPNGRYNTDTLKPYEEKLEKFDRMCGEIGETPADIALAWVLANPVVTSVMIGPRTAGQLIENIKAVDIVLPGDFLKELDKLWQGFMGEAPEAYAW